MAQSQWYILNKKADFKEIGQHFNIDPVTARIIRNRDIMENDEIEAYLNGSVEHLCNPHLMKDGDLLVQILRDRIHQKKSIRVIGDYDIDGVMSTYLLMRALTRVGAQVTTVIPDRIRDGYGLNCNLVDQAYKDGVDTILTCDNGIAATDEIAHAVSLGMTVLVTDHHEPPYEINPDGTKHYLRSDAAAIVNPHQPDCPYPYKDLCGAGVAWKMICLLYEAEGIAIEEAEDLLEFVAFATVGDIMNLTGENRILVKEGLKRIHHSQNIGMRALIARCGLEPEQIEAYHFGFVLGPCINASGRLDTAQRALSLFLQTDRMNAMRDAEELVVLNQERKAMTERGVEEAVRVCEANGYQKDAVLVIYLPDVHESIAGIIAGRIRDKYYRPTFILTKSEDGIKGSGRSLEEYSMYDEMCKCRECFTKFGGHPMAAGLSMKEENIDVFRKQINEVCPLEARCPKRKIKIDVPMPISYVRIPLVKELNILAPFGKGNPRPVFADRDLAIRKLRIVGHNRNVLQLSLRTSDGCPAAGVFFGDIPAFEQYLTDKFGQRALASAYEGKENPIRISVIYYPKVNTWQGREELQFEIQDYR